MLETITALATCFNGLVLTGIWFKLGTHSEKHISHERRFEENDVRLTFLERNI